MQYLSTRLCLIWRSGVILCLLLWLFGTVGCRSIPRPPIGTDCGPLVSRLPSVDGVDRTRALLGVFEHSVATNGATLTACRPLWARASNPETDVTHTDMLYPLGNIRDRDERRAWRFVTLYGLNDDVDDPDSRSFFWLFPFIYTGTSREGAHSSGFFPFYGTIRDMGSIEEARFVLFPVYASTTDGETHATMVMWPFFRRAVGPRDDQLRVWPFYGYHIRDDRWDKRFIAWPFWTEATFFYPGQKGRAFILFPFYGQSDLGKGTLRMYLPPLFQFARWEDGSMVRAPWPFFEWSRNGEDYRHKLWPLIADKQVGHTRGSYALWPFLWRTRIDRSQQVSTSYRAIPFLYANKTVSTKDPTAGDVTQRDFMFWPLFDYRRRGQESLTRSLYLWPLRRTRGIERSWAPLWTLYARQRSGDAIETELLWGLYRHQRQPGQWKLSIFPLVSMERDRQDDAAGWTLLCGLLGHRRIGDESAWKLLFMGGNPPTGETAAAVDVPDGVSAK